MLFKLRSTLKTVNCWAENYPLRNMIFKVRKCKSKLKGPTYSWILLSKIWTGLEYQRLPGEISVTSDMQMTPPLWQKAKKN